MKALIFAMNHRESGRLADQLSAELERGGVTTVVCDHWMAAGFDATRLTRASGSALLNLSDLGFSSIPRLSSRQYVEIFGDDIDFLGVNGLTYAAFHYPQRYLLAEIFLNTESEFYQRLRGFAARIDHLLRAVAPDVVVIQQGSDVISRLIFAKVLKRGIPWLCSESSFFKGYRLLDPAGQHFFPGLNKIARDWPAVRSRPLAPQESARVRQYIDDWKASKSSKYMQPAAVGDRERIAAFLGGSDGPILFVPMQVPVDASVHHSLGGFLSLEEFYEELIRRLPQGWRVIFKAHPKDTHGKLRPEGAAARVLVVQEANIHDLLQAATAVAVFSSNVGMEALLYGKPVIVAGKPYYAAKGLCIEVAGAEELPDALERSRHWRVDLELRDRLLHYLLFEYLIAEGDTDALLRRIDEAMALPPAPIDPRQPFSEFDPFRTASHIALIRQYDGLARQNFTYREIMPRLAPPDFCIPAEAEKDDVTGGERQAGASLSRIEAGHVARYAFVSSVIPAGVSVLDIAAGSGYGAYLLAERGASRVTAVDASAAAIAYARSNWRHSAITYRAASAGTFFSDSLHEAYDVVISFATIEYLRNPRLFLEQAWRRLRPGGVLFLSATISDRHSVLNNSLHVEHFNPGTLRSLLADAQDMEEFQCYGQHGNRIASAENEESRYLVAAIFKKGTEDGWRISPQTVRSAIPYAWNGTAVEENFLRQKFKLLSRRKLWIHQLLKSSAGIHKLGRKRQPGT